MTSASLVIMSSLWLAFAVVANAQLAKPGGSGEPDSRPVDTPLRPSIGEEPPGESNAAPATNLSSICQMIASAAAANGLPYDFFAQIIWRESRLRSDVVGPVTRSGQRAQGIAQFMPGTAAERRLRDPFDPVQALPKSAEFLRDLRVQFGNLGLAAAAYNAGPQRVRDWLAGKRALPLETQNYVRNVTGHTAAAWAKPGQIVLAAATPKDMPCTETATAVATAQSPSGAAQPKSVEPKPVESKPPSEWGVQLVGDRSEIRAVAIFRQLQTKHKALLGIYEPVVIRTMLRGGAAPIWSRVRVEASSRQAADALCSRLRSAGESCLVQRN
jgi:hypothetical protein